MALKGSLEEAGLPDIFQLVALGRKTGCLAVTDQCNLAHVYFRDGRVVFASVVNREDRLGQRLLAEGYVDEADLAAALGAQEGLSDRRLGELLVERGALEPADLRKALASQAEETVYTLVTWDRGYFHFEPGQEPAPGEVLVSLDVSGLLLEGARRADEWERIRKRIPHSRLIPARAAATPVADDGAAAPDAIRVWQLVDGRRDVAAIVSAGAIGELRTLSALSNLAGAGRVFFVGESLPARDERPSRRREEVRNLALAFYAAGMHVEAAREFRQLAVLDARDADAHFHVGLAAFHAGELDEAREAFARSVELAPDGSSGRLNLALCLEALRRTGEAREVVHEVLRRHPGCAPATLHMAILLYRDGAYAEALRLLEGLELEPRLAAVRDFYLGLLHALFGDLRGAGGLLTPLAHEGRNARALVNLGAVLERGGRLAEARAVYAAALELGGAESVAGKNLGDLYQREGMLLEARRSYLLSVRHDPANAAAWNQLAILALREGRRPEAMAYLTRAREGGPAADARARSELELASQLSSRGER